MDLNKIDKTIITTLTSDARTPFRKIARELDVSPDTISNHFKKLQKLGVIVGSTIVINPEKIGYTTIVRFGFKVKPTFSSEILSHIIKMPSIIVATKLMGEFDIIALGVIKDFNHLFKLRDKFVKMSNIEKVDISIWIKTMSLRSKYFII